MWHFILCREHNNRHILWPLGTIYDHLVYFMVGIVGICLGLFVYFPRFDTLHQENYGNPDVHT
jgi:hypothetical protein